MAINGKDAYGAPVRKHRHFTAEEIAGMLVCGITPPDGVPLGAQPAVIAALVALLQAADDRLQSFVSREMES